MSVYNMSQFRMIRRNACPGSWSRPVPLLFRGTVHDDFEVSYALLVVPKLNSL